MALALVLLWVQAAGGGVLIGLLDSINVLLYCTDGLQVIGNGLGWFMQKNRKAGMRLWYIRLTFTKGWFPFNLLFSPKCES